ncbi:HYR domain-containing protein [Agromyces sp. CF514]|uniref:HYR domain-containing protein n=1 Tax=Agromyces sp. CF514 TaxID=1881031 RepID=UPI0008EA8474|nr:HYR domain-containing protein [Agromyces sp. CF514]SFR90931.1 HYR domain-containing protein [Agromyces sp. CF514]
MSERVPWQQAFSARPEPIERTTRRGIRSLVPLKALLAGLASAALVVLSIGAPAFAAPPSFVDPPTRLYMAPAGSLPVTIPDGFPTVIPEGDLKFDGGTDLISQDVRTIEIESGEDGCAMAAPDWNQGGCTAVQLSVSHGTLTFDPLPSVEDDGDSDFDVLKFADGALERDKHELSELPAAAVAIIGTTAQVNAALATLVYTPDTDEDDDGTADDPYFYNGSNPESIDLLMAPGDSTMDTVNADIEIRVQRINEFPEVTVPDQVFQVPSGGTGFLGDAGDDTGQPDEEDWNVVDEDNDENDENDTLDGPGDEWLLISWADCGTFSMPASPFTIYDDLEQLFGDALDLGLEPDPADPEYAEYQTNKTALIEAAMAALPDEVKNLPFATGNPSDPHSAFAGVVSGLNAIDSLNYALDNVEFQATGLADVTCTVRYLVSDLGNNGLPVQYLGDPPYGIQVPFFGFDFDTNDFPTVEKVVVEVGDGTTIEVALPTDVSVPEGGATTVPLTVSPATHPAFAVTISTAAVAPTSAADFTPIAAQTFTVPEDAASIDIPVDALQDTDLDPGETYTVTIDGFPADPPFPAGFDAAITDGSATVTIIDDEVPNELLELSLPTDVAVAEGAASTVPLVVSPTTHPAFDVTISTTAVPPTSAADFTPITAQAFTVPADAASIDIPVDALQDLDLDPGETYTVTIDGVPGSPPPGFDVAITDGSATVTIIDDETEDTIAPTVTIEQGAAQADPTDASPIVFDVEFSEPVTGFDNADVVLSGSANPTTAVVSGAGASYTVEVSGMSANGLVVAEVAAGAAEDAAGNLSEASTSVDNEVTFTGVDDVAPTVTIEQGAAQADPTGTSPIVFEVEFSEPVTGFGPADVVLSGAANPTTAVVSGTAANYTVEVSGMSADGLVVAEVAAGAAEDAAGNLSEASTSVDNEVTFEYDEGDVTAPTVTIEQGAAQADPTDASPIVFEVEFSEPVTGFDNADVVLSGSANPTTAVVAGVGASYTVQVSGMSANGLVIAEVAAGAAEDAAGNLSEASTSVDNEVTFTGVDDVAPTVTIEQGAAQTDPTGTSPIVFEVEFSELVTGFDNADVVLSGPANPTTAVVSGAGASYTVEVSGMSADGLVIAEVVAGAAEDAAGNLSEASTSVDNEVTFQYDEGDVTAPTVTIEQGGSQGDPALVSSQPVVFDVVFSEPVSGFVNTDVVLSGSGNPTTAVVTPVSSSAYTVEVSGAVAGEVVAEVVAGAAEDAAGNLSEASTSVDNVVTLEDVASPDPLTITAPDDIVVEVPFGETGANVDFDAPTTTGGVAPVTVDCDATSGDFFAIGVTTVTCTATDSAPPEQIVLFAVATDSFTITVNEGDEPPGEPTPTPTDPGTPGGGSGSGSSGGTTGGMAATGVESMPTLLIGLGMLLAGGLALRLRSRARRAAASARR